MVFECYRWILHLFKKITEHRRRRRLILHYSNDDYYPRIFIIDGKSEKEYRAWGQLEALEFAHTVNFCNGLVLLKSGHPPPQHVVFDPLSNKIMTRISPLFAGGFPCALFFHPLAKEYRILNVREIKTGYYEYHIYLFGSKTWRRIANPYFNSRPPSNLLEVQNGNKIINGNPASSNGALHWYMDEILIFDMIREEFCLKTLPFRVRYVEPTNYCLPDLLVNEDDHLCCCYMRCPRPVMDIWVLEDYANWYWVQKYAIGLNWEVPIIPLILDRVLVLTIYKDELVLYLDCRGVFSYHLRNNTVKAIKLKNTTRLFGFRRSAGFMGCIVDR